MDQFLQLASFHHKEPEDSVRSVGTLVDQYRTIQTEGDRFRINEMTKFR